jgi:hypothetical protein
MGPSPDFDGSQSVSTRTPEEASPQITEDLPDDHPEDCSQSDLELATAEVSACSFSVSSPKPCFDCVSEDHSILIRLVLISQGEVSTFRPTVTQVKASIDTVCISFCNDRPHSYGAPDFFLLTSNHASAVGYMEQNMPNQPADVVAQMSVVAMAEYLDNSSGIWSRLVSPWPVEMSARLTGNQARTSKYTTEVRHTSTESPFFRAITSTFKSTFVLNACGNKGCGLWSCCR